MAMISFITRAKYHHAIKQLRKQEKLMRRQIFAESMSKTNDRLETKKVTYSSKPKTSVVDTK